MLTIEQSQHSPGVIVLTVQGRVCMGRYVQELEWKVDELLAGQQRHIVLDVSKVTHMDSTGIGIVVLCAGKLKEAGGGLRIAGAAGIVDNVLRLTKVDTLVPLFANVEEATIGLKAAGAS